MCKTGRIARDRLSESELRVAKTYANMRALRGALARLTGILKDDPNFTHRDEVYYRLGEIYFPLQGADNKAQARMYYQRLVDEFVESEFLERAAMRLKELNAQ